MVLPGFSRRQREYPTRCATDIFQIARRTSPPRTVPRKKLKSTTENEIAGRDTVDRSAIILKGAARARVVAAASP